MNRDLKEVRRFVMTMFEGKNILGRRIGEIFCGVSGIYLFI